jgi:1-acyl-sn-glycerol-3-phosphate acyltransferase
MHPLVVDKPYHFIAPRHGRFWPWVLRPLMGPMLRRGHGVVRVECHGVERLRESLAAGHGVMLAPNHTRPADPLVLAVLSERAGRPFFYMSSWHLFMMNRVLRFLLPRAGVFSIYREGLDREALKCAIRILVEARRPLVIFPEGVISRHNDVLNHLMEGTALMARGAARQRAEATPPGRVVIHPVALRYRFGGDAEDAVRPVLADIERRLTWRLQEELGTVDRVVKVGSALLGLKETEYLGGPQAGTLAARVEGLIDRILAPLEAEWLKGRREPDVIGRVKTLRFAMVPDLVGGDIGEAERERRWRQLADIYLAQQLSFYPAEYFTPAPTPERILETVERFEEDLTDSARVHSPWTARVEVGEAIEVGPERVREAGGDPVMRTLRERLEAMLAASRRPDAA